MDAEVALAFPPGVVERVEIVVDRQLAVSHQREHLRAVIGELAQLEGLRWN